MDVPSDKHKEVGLNHQEVLQNRKRYGENLLTPPKRQSLWKLYLEKFQDPVIRILLLAALLSLIISFYSNEFAETIGILIAVFLSTSIAFFFEYDASRKFDLLNAVGDTLPIKVIREGKVVEVPKNELVVNDIVLVETGDEIPADGVLLEAVSLQVNESALTGELVVTKQVEEQKDHSDTYPVNRIYRGTMVTNGHAKYVVTAVGDSTEIGKVASLSFESQTIDTPLNQQLKKLATLIGKVGFTVAGITFLAFVARDLISYFSQDVVVTGFNLYLDIANILLKYFMVAVTLIVVAVPEGLPMSVTLSLALNMRRMLATNNLVRKLHASETMGAITVICTDKTGTLTQNRMAVDDSTFYCLNKEQRLNCDVEACYLIAEGISVNSTAHLDFSEKEEQPTLVGNPTEGALLYWLHNQSVDYLSIREDARVLEQEAFSTENKYMATKIYSSRLKKKILYVKGAPEVLVAKCSHYLDEQGCEESYEAKLKNETEKQLAIYQGKAMRTLAFAYKIVDDTLRLNTKEEIEEGRMVLLGVVGIVDPIRPDVAGAVARCQSAGIAIKIVTGDTTKTAVEIARQIGLWTKDDDELSHITGAEFEALTDSELLVRLEKLKIMSRARPTDKQRLVRLLQEKGEVVAVTGDGTNDAPALNRAHVGLSMGTGTAVAKEASDITLMDDSFNSISTAVMWGRSLYKNIQRFLLFQLTINLVALLVVLLGSFIGTEIPLTVTQMLWVNLIMDTFAALALASIPADVEVMKEKPRAQNAFIITKQMAVQIVGVGLLFVALLVGILKFIAINGLSLGVKELTMFFTFFVLLQFWNLFNAAVYGTNRSIFSRFSWSYGISIVSILIVAGQFIIVEFGGAMFRTVPLDFMTWMKLLFYSSFVLWAGEIVRFVRRLMKK